TQNNTPSQEVTQGTEKKFLSSENILQGLHRPFHLQHLVAFGTQCTCFISAERREERKGPGQTKAYTGVIIGYADGMHAYRVWDLEKKKTREVSFYFCIVSEGYFPFKDRRNCFTGQTPFLLSFSRTLFTSTRVETLFFSKKKKKKF